jgi:uncharacterized OB-fold protein
MAEWYHPVIEVDTEHFWKGAKDGKLFLKKCGDCGKTHYYPRRYCPSCWSENTAWLEASRKGTVYSYSVVHQNPAPPFKDLTPYAVVLVDLAEGPRMMVNWDFQMPLDQLKCGLPVEVAFRKVTDELSLPIARPGK